MKRSPRTLYDLTIEAADALWDLGHGEKPKRDAVAINQDIYEKFRGMGYPRLGRPVSQEEVLYLFKEMGGIISGSHIVYTSGMHGEVYVNKDALYTDPIKTSFLCQALAEHFVDDEIDVVVAPAIGGVMLTSWVAYHLSDMCERKVFSVYAEKAEGGFVIKRGYDKVIRGNNVLVVEDIVTTGISAKKVIEVARASGGVVVGLGVLCNRGGIQSEDVGDVPKLISLLDLELRAWTEEACRLSGPCARGVEINTDVGKGREFLAKKQ